MSQENLNKEEGIKKLRELAENARICMFCTGLDQRPIPSRTMSLQEVSGEGILWFISGKDSDKNHELRKDSEVQLYFNKPSDSEYLAVYGNAEIYTDQETIDAHWSKMANAWFNGKEDPNVSIIGVRAKEAKFWDTKNGKWIQLAKIGLAALTESKPKDLGEVGEINL